MTCSIAHALRRIGMSLGVMCLALSAVPAFAQATMFDAQRFINNSSAYSTCVTGAPNVPNAGQCVVTADVCGGAIAVRRDAQAQYDEMAKNLARAASCASNFRPPVNYVAACERNRCTLLNMVTGVRGR